MSSDWFKKVSKAISVTATTTAEVVRDTAISTADAVRTTAGVGVGSISFVDVKQVDYEPGDTISGTLRLSLEEETDADKLVVRLSATGSRTRVEKSQGNKSIVQDRETLYTFDLEVDGEKTYPSGEKTYKFSMRIPVDAESEVSIPDAGLLTEVVKVASALSRGVKHPTKWTLLGFLDIPWKRNVKKELAIQVMDSD